MSEGAESRVWRLLHPRSVAVVGASERNAGLRRMVEEGIAGGVSFSLVNPRATEVYGQRAFPTLLEVDRPVDVVLSLVAADATLEVAAQAGAIGAAGVVAVAAQFAEVGELGAKRQAALVEVAGEAGLAVMGPNCMGFFNVVDGINLSPSPLRFPELVGPGKVGFVAQSGGMYTSLFFGAGERRMGVSYAISSGNEAVTDLCDFLEVLLEDERTEAVGLVIEEVRRPGRFVELAYRARGLGKPLVALKLGRSERGRFIAHSHTGALMQDARDYDAAFKQCGVGIAADVDDLLDQLQLFAHWPRRWWHGSGGTAVVTASGGSAGAVSDAFEAAGLALPEDPGLAAYVRESIPGAGVGNPIDVTGINWAAGPLGNIYGRYLASDFYDTLMVMGYLAAEQEDFARPMVEPLQAAAAESAKRLVMVSTETVRVGAWVEEALLARGVAVGRGVPQTLRSLKAMDDFARVRSRPRVGVDPAAVAVGPPAAVATAQGRLGRFEATMALLERFGIPVAAWAAWPASAAQLDGLARDCGRDRFVVKLADVLHRTDHQAVRVGVARAELAGVADELGELAGRAGLPARVVVQGQLQVLGEMFFGIQAHSLFGPVVLAGIGGVFLEVLHDSTARLAPFGPADAADMLAELAGSAVLHGVRGGQAWHPDQLIQLLTNLSRLALASQPWLDTLDINPVVVHANGLAAVDAACLIRPEA